MYILLKSYVETILLLKSLKQKSLSHRYGLVKLPTLLVGEDAIFMLVQVLYEQL